MKLSKRETLIYNAFKSSSEDRDCAIAPEEIADILWKGSRPKAWRTMVLSTMRLLCARTQSMTPRVIRVSKVGRGNEARYSLEKEDG